MLQASTEDEVVVGNLLPTGQEDVFGLPSDAHQLPRHHSDEGTHWDLGQVSAAVGMTA